MSNLSLSMRGQNAPSSPVRSLVPFADEAKKRGVRVLGVNIGEPDLPPPAIYTETLKKFTSTHLGYAPARGLSVLRDAWAHRFSEETGCQVSGEEVIVAAGGSEAILLSIAVVTDPGDEILVLEPTYANYLGLSGMLGVSVKAITQQFSDGFSPPTIAQIESAITTKTKCILIGSPGNPTGKVLPREFLTALAVWANQRGIWVITDECYRTLLFSGEMGASMLDDAPNVIVIDSMSKRFSLCGTRIGMVLARSTSFLDAVYRFGSQRLAVSVAEQTAAAAVLNATKTEELLGTGAIFSKRYQAFADSLSNFPEISHVTPDGAFYCIVSLPDTVHAGLFARFLLAEYSEQGETAWVTPASGFYVTPGLGTSLLRIAFVLNESAMERVARIIGGGLNAFQKMPSTD